MTDLQEPTVSLEDKHVTGETFIHTMILHACIKIIEENETAILNNFDLIGFCKIQHSTLDELKITLEHVLNEIDEIPRLIMCDIKEAQSKVLYIFHYCSILKWFTLGAFAASTKPFNLSDRDIINLQGLLKIASYYQKLLITINKEITFLTEP